MPNLARFSADLMDLDVVKIFDDFTGSQSDVTFIDTVTDTGSVTVGDAVNGIITLDPSDATVADNDEAYLATPNELFKFGTNRQIYARARIQFTEANTDDANVFFGFQNAIAADSLVDDGAGMRTTGSNAVIYKVDGGTVWRCQSMCNDVATDSISTTTAGGSSYQVLEIELNESVGASEMSVTFKVDGVSLRDSNDNIIRHQVAIANATEMDLGFGVKNGDTNLELLLVDYVYAAQTRV